MFSHPKINANLSSNNKLLADEEIQQATAWLEMNQVDQRTRYKTVDLFDYRKLPPDLIVKHKKIYAINRGKDNSLGKGAYGAVKLVQDLSDGKLYALKIVKLDLQVVSIEILNKVKNNICKERDALKQVGMYVTSYRRRIPHKNSYQFEILMKLAPGDSLRDLINYGAINSVNYVEICSAIIRAVEKVHHKKILHCDIKPDNIFYCMKTKQATLVDFGLALEYPVTTLSSRRGSARYMAPEIKVKNQRTYNYSAETDIFSLAVTIAECLQLEEFYVDPSAVSLSVTSFKNNRIIADDVIRNSIAETLKKMTSPNPKNRNLHELKKLFGLLNKCNTLNSQSIYPTNLFISSPTTPSEVTTLLIAPVNDKQKCCVIS